MLPLLLINLTPFLLQNSIGLYKNQIQFVDEVGNKIKYKRLVGGRQITKRRQVFVSNGKKNTSITHLMKLNSDFNISSMAFKREILVNNLEIIANIKGMTDTFLFWISFISNYDIYVDYESLTRYRVHTKNTSRSNSIENDFKRQIEALNLLKEDILYLSKNCGKIVVNSLLFTMRGWVELLELEYLSIYDMLTNNNKKKVIKNLVDLIRYPIKYNNVLRSRLLLFSFLYILNKSIALNLYTVLRKG